MVSECDRAGTRTEAASLKPTIEVSDFSTVDLRVGTITDARLNEKARKPAYVLTIDFGPTLGTKQSSAQLTYAYQPAELVGRSIVAVVNFAPKRVAGVKSEVLVLASVESDGRTILLTPERPVPAGTPVA